jgi:HlyD family secretion protein
LVRISLVSAYLMENLPVLTSKRRWPLTLGIGAAIIGMAGIGAYAFNNFRPNSNVDLAKLTVEAMAQDVTLKIAANGSVLPGQTVNLSPRSAGRVAAIFVEQGDIVRQGQQIAQMENADVRAQIAEAQANLRQAQANLARGRNGSRPEEIAQAQSRLAAAQATLARTKNGNRPQEIAQVRARLEQVKSNLALSQSIAPQQVQQAEAQIAAAAARQNLAKVKLARFQNLANQGAITQDRLDEVMADYQTTTATYLEAQQRLQQIKNNSRQEIAQRSAAVAEAEQNLQQQQAGSRSEDVDRAEADVEQAKSSLEQAKNGSRPEDVAQLTAAVDTARARLNAAQVQMQETLILAPFDGVITQRYASVGAFVTPTTTASREGQATSTSVVAIAKDLEVKAKVPEVDIGKVSVGQKVEVTADSYPDTKFQATVRIVAPEAVVEQNVTSFEVRLGIDSDPDQKLRSGMNVNVSFVGKSVPASLMVPTVAIVRKKGKDGVLVPGKDNQPEFKEVETGFNVRDKTQILSGIQSGDRVFIDTPKGFKLNNDKEK